MRIALLAAAGIACGLGSLPSSAQELQVAGPAASRASIAAPTRGTSMDQVQARFGPPTERYAAVGQPPITRWVYPTFVVYFEYSHVVHAVAIRPAPEPG